METYDRAPILPPQPSASLMLRASLNALWYRSLAPVPARLGRSVRRSCLWIAARLAAPPVPSPLIECDVDETSLQPVPAPRTEPLPATLEPSAHRASRTARETAQTTVLWRRAG
jgi:hypothetical protein